MGNRSTKGYPVLTERPIHCLAKTCAHELGHALDLDHPKGQVFSDGTPHTAVYGNKNNLMTGGVDHKGGGGSMLETWQILVARQAAETFLKSLN
jgi:phytoene dehydrogenase-like protein